MKNLSNMRKILAKSTAVFMAFLLTLALLTSATLSHFTPTVYADDTATASDDMTIKIDTVQVTLDQLKDNNYIVTVPVSVPTNPGFYFLNFGVSWNVDEMIAIGLTSQAACRYSFAFNYSFIWLPFISATLNTKTSLCKIQLQVNDSAQPGDFFEIKGENTAYDGSSSNYLGENGAQGVPSFINGGVQIVDHNSANVNVSLGKVGLQESDLQKSNYVVSVPVTCENSGFQTLEFGVSFKSGCLTSELHVSDLPAGLSCEITTGDNWIWLKYTAESGYAKSTLGTLKFQVYDGISPGERLDLKYLSSSDNGDSALVTNILGEAGILTVDAGYIRLSTSSYDTESDGVNVTIPTIELTKEQLEANDYLIEIPLTVSGDAFAQMSFGISWDADKLTPENYTNNNPTLLSTVPMYNSTKDFLWMPYVSRTTGAGYTGSSLATITLRVSEDVQEGDVLNLMAENVSTTNSAAFAMDINSELLPLNITDGAIKIVSQEEKDVDLCLRVADLTFTKDELEELGYEVEVPVYADKNNGFTRASFGLIWDKENLVYYDAQCGENMILSAQTAGSRSGEAWMNFVAMSPEDSYGDKNGIIGKLIFSINEDIEAGTRIPILLTSISADETHTADVLNADYNHSVPVLISGSITIQADEPVVTTDDSGENGPSILTMTEETTTAPIAETTTTVTTEDISSNDGIAHIGDFTVDYDLYADPAVTTISDATTPYLSPTNIIVAKGHARQMAWLNSDSDSSEITWDVKDTSIAQVSLIGNTNMVYLMGIHPGVTTVTVSEGEYTQTCQVIVIDSSTSCALVGDADLDQSVSICDLVIILKMTMGAIQDDYTQSTANADTNRDGTVDINDAITLYEFLMRKTAKLGAS